VRHPDPPGVAQLRSGVRRGRRDHGPDERRLLVSLGLDPRSERRADLDRQLGTRLQGGVRHAQPRAVQYARTVLGRAAWLTCVSEKLALVKTLATVVIAIVLIIAMTWIVVSPTTDEAASKAALLVVGSAVGFMFGRETA